MIAHGISSSLVAVELNPLVIRAHQGKLHVIPLSHFAVESGTKKNTLFMKWKRLDCSSYLDVFLIVINRYNEMAEENVTHDNNRSTIQELYCSTEFTGEVHQELIALSVVNIFLSTTAVLGNTLILVALHRASSLHPPSKLLCRNLAATGLCVGCIVGAAASFLLDICCGWNMECLPVRSCGKLYHRIYFMFSIPTYSDGDKRGQTSCAVAATQIQTSCNSEESIHNYNCVLGSVHYRYFN